MRTDQMFKDLLRTFFADFLSLFLSEVFDAIDPDSITFLDTELFTDFPEGQQRLADLVAQVRTRDGTQAVVLLHTEVQAQRQDDFGRRMWQYNVLLRLREGVPTISIAIVLYGDTPGISLEHYGDTIFGRTYPLLDYWQIGLRDLQAADYLGADQPLAAALAALMQPGPAGRAALKLEALRRIGGSALDPARVFSLVTIVECFLPLRPEEESMLWQQLRQEGVLEMATTDLPWGELTWADRVRLDAEREMLARLLRRRFGDVPEALSLQIGAADTPAVEAMFDRAVMVSTVEEMLRPEFPAGDGEGTISDR